MSIRFVYRVRPLRFLDHEEQEFYLNILRGACSVLFCCLTFQHEPGSDKAKQHFDEFLNAVAFHYKANIGAIWSLEKAFANPTTSTIRRHLHCILISNAMLSVEIVKRLWTAGNAKAAIYDFSRDGVGYILKLRDMELCEWGLENMHFFSESYEPPDKSARQALRRHQIRTNCCNSEV